MSTNLNLLQSRKVSQKWNQKLSIKQFTNKYSVDFEMGDDAIDLRTMSKNFMHGIIPLEDINQGIAAVLGGWRRIGNGTDASKENRTP